MSFRRPAAFGFVLLLAVPGAARAVQAVPTDAAPLVVRQWDTRGGLPQNTVNDIVQTPDGYLWIATFGGLVRFDGVRFTPFLSRVHPGIGSDRALSLAVDSAARVWVGTETGLVRLAAGTFTTFTTRDGLPDNLVNRVFVDRRGRVWAATEQGLARYADGPQPFAAVPLPAVARELGEDDAGTLWLRTDAGLMRLDTTSGRFVADSTILPPRAVVRLIGQDRQRGLWFAVPDGLVRWSGGALGRRYGAADGVDSGVVRLAASGDSTYWLASPQRGLWSFDPGARGRKIRRYALPQGGRAYNARVVYVDREGVVWAGTNVNGLLGLRRRVFTMLQLVQGDAVSSAAVLGDRSGRVWIGANCDAVNVLEGGRLRLFTTAAGQDVRCVWSLAVGNDRAVWLGTWGDFLYRLVDGRLEQLGAAQGLPNDVVLAMLPAREGSVWVGTLQGGLARLRAGRPAVVYDTSNGLAHNHVNTIVEGRDGTVWIGTVGGLNRFRDGRITTFTTASGLSHNHVRAVLEDPDGTLWIGTYGGGLTRLRGGRFRAITREDGLFDDQLSAVVDAGLGYLWLSSNRGVFRVSRRDLAAFADGRATSVHSGVYGEADGLETVEANGGFQPSAWRAPDGRIWFPTIRGVAILDPAAAAVNRAAPTVRIEQVVVDGRAVPLEELVRVPSGAGTVEVVYTGLSSSAPEAVTFRYRLEGVDRDWVEAGDRRVAYFAHLPTGSYRFTVGAANRDGLPAAELATLRLVIRPPLHTTWWFRLLVAGSLVSATTGVVRLRLAARTLAAEHAFARRLIESQESERKRIASELHDTIGQDLLVVKNRAELALRTTDVDGPAREQLEKISGIVSDTLRHTREIAHNLRPAQLDRLGLCTAVRSAIEQVAEASGIAFQVDTGEVDGLLAPEAEISVFRIIQEGVNNILKHAQASRAEVRLERDGGDVRLMIRDNGRGFPRDRAPGTGLGINSITERVRLLGGSIDVRSVPESGVTLTIRIPHHGAERAR